MWRRTIWHSFPHSQPTFLHIIIPSWELTVSMYQIGSLICSKHKWSKWQFCSYCVAPVVHVWLIVERMERQGFCVLGLMILYSPGVMNQAYKLRLILPEPHTCQSRGTRCKRTQWNTTIFFTSQSTMMAATLMGLPKRRRGLCVREQQSYRDWVKCFCWGKERGLK